MVPWVARLFPEIPEREILSVGVKREHGLVEATEKRHMGEPVSMIKVDHSVFAKLNFNLTVR